jgi:hypothetical protein
MIKISKFSKTILGALEKFTGAAIGTYWLYRAQVGESSLEQWKFWGTVVLLAILYVTSVVMAATAILERQNALSRQQK